MATAEEKLGTFMRATPDRPAPIVTDVPSIVERTVIIKNPDLIDADDLEEGDELEYTKEFAQDLPAFQSRNSLVNRDSGLELRPGHKYIVGEDVGIDLARRLVERGILRK